MRYLTALLATTMLALCGCGPASEGGFHIIDNTAPFAVITSPANGSQVFGTTAVNFSGSDSESNVSWVEVTVNGTTIYSSPQHGNVVSSTSFTPGTAGDYVIVLIVDSEGGRSTNTVTVNVPF